MKKSIFLIFILATLCVNFSPALNHEVFAANTTYYVSSTDGNDDNNGTSSSTPWKTLSKVSTVTFGSGDTIRLKGGDVWNGEFLVLQGSGTASSPIILTSYGTERPKIIYKGPVITLENLSGWTIKGLEINILSDKTFTINVNSDPAINLVYTGTGVYHDIKIDDNLIYGEGIDRRTRGIGLISWYKYNYSDELLQNLTITNNVIYNIGYAGISTQAWNSGGSQHILTPALYYNVKIHNNIIHDIGAAGIILGEANHGSIKWNKIYNVGQYARGDMDGGTAGIMPIISSHVDIMYNEIYDVGDNGSSMDAAGIDIDWFSEFITAKYNYIYRCAGGGVETMAVINSKIQNNKVKEKTGSTIIGEGMIVLTDYSGIPTTFVGNNHTEVSGNMIYVDEDNKTGISSKYFSGGTWTGNKATDNSIILPSGVTGAKVYNIGINTSIGTTDNNRIYSSSGSTFIADYQGTNYTSLASWQTGTQHDWNSGTSILESTAPENVTNLTASWNATIAAVDLSWTAASDGGSGISHYNIYRSTTSGFTPGYTNMVGESTGTSFSDKEELVSSTTYYYKVEAEDKCGNVSSAPPSANTSTGTISTPPLREFQASKDFSSMIQGPVWAYQSWDGSSYSNLNYDVTQNVWLTGTYCYVGSNYQHPESNKDSVRKWIAPFDGNITITASGQISLWSSGGDGVNVKVLKNGAQIWPASGWQLATYGNPVSFPSTSVTVTKGDAIYFILNRNNTITADGTTWDPIITYTSLTLPAGTVPTFPAKLPDKLLEQKYYYDFEDGSSSGWTVASGTWSVVTDGTKMYKQSNSAGGASIIGDSSWSDYTIETKIKPLSFGSGGASGIEFMRKDSNNKYALWLCGNNTIKLSKYTSGNETVLAPSAAGRTKSFTVTTGTTYNIKINVYRCKETGGQAIEVYINGLMELSATDTSSIYTAGQVVLNCSSSTGEFDDFSLNKGINLWGEPQQILLFNDFENGSSSDWTVESGTWAVTTDMTRKYKQTETGDSIANAGSSLWSDYGVQSKVKIISTGAGEGVADICFRYSNSSNKYFTSISTTNGISIKKTVSGTTTSLASKSYTISTGTEYTVIVTVNANNIDLYINGKKELSTSDSAMTSGKIALHTNNATVMFDDVVVQKWPGNPTVYFSDDFESGQATNWNIDSGSWSVVNDTTKQYKQTGLTAGKSHAGDSAWNNYVLMYRIKITDSGIDAGYGNIYFRHTDGNNSYYVELSPFSGIALKKIVSGTYSTLQSNTSYRVLKNTEYRVKIIANGSSIDVYINGRKELSATDTSLASGNIALWTNTASVMYDDIVVRTVD